MRSPSHAERWFGRAAAAGVLVSCASVTLLMAIGAADIAGTYLGSPIPGAIEVMESLMVLVIFLALPEVEMSRKHIAVDLIVRRLPGGLRKATSILGDVLSLAFFGAMAWKGWQLFHDSWSVREYAAGLLPFPIYPFKALFAVSVTMVSAIALMNLVSSAVRGGSKT